MANITVMGNDSLRRTLGLAQAILEWTAPQLLDRLRAANAAIDPKELSRWGREPLESILDRRARPERGRVMSMVGRPDAVIALDRAWDGVINALRLKVERGEICLSGRMTRPEMRMEPEPIPSSWATELDFDVRGAAIFVRDETYVAVTAMKPVRDQQLEGDANGLPDAGSSRDLRSDAEHLSLLKAMTTWCDAKLVARIQDEERKLLAYELHQYKMPKLLDESEWRQPTRGYWAQQDYVFLNAAWNNLTRDFRRRIEASELYLEGVLSGDDPAAQPETIPNVWAAELQFDLDGNAVARGSRRYLAVMASKRPSPWAPFERGPQTTATSVPSGPITDADVRKLTDDEVLRLLEDHARRVVENDAPMMAPGKISVMPIIKRKLEFRASKGLLETTVAAEAAVLESWIVDRLPSHQTPTAGSIENSLRKEYAALKARSNGMKP